MDGLADTTVAFAMRYSPWKIGGFCRKGRTYTDGTAFRALLLVPLSIFFSRAEQWESAGYFLKFHWRTCFSLYTNTKNAFSQLLN